MGSSADTQDKESLESYYKTDITYKTILDSTRRTIKLDKLEPLTGQDNYMIWSATMKHVFKSLKIAKIVIDGAVPKSDVTQEERAAYDELCDEANTILIQVVSPEILKMIVTMDKPAQMWTYLRDQYYRDTAYALVSQIMNLVSLPNLFNSQPTSISDFITKFEAEWQTLINMATTGKTDSYRQSFSTFLGQDKAKRDFLLGFLVRQNDWKNIVDNLTTKDALTYSDVKRHLLSTASDSATTENALSSVQSNKKKPNNKKKGSSSSSTNNNYSPSPSTGKECTWCKKHHPGRHNGHLWNECNKLKAHNEEKKRTPQNLGNKRLHMSPLLQTNIKTNK